MSDKKAIKVFQGRQKKTPSPRGVDSLRVIKKRGTK